MKNLINALVYAVIIGFAVGFICMLLGQIPHLGFLASYDVLIGLVAGILTFLNRWDGGPL